MKTSIVIPAYNSERFIDKTIASVAAQSDSDWELVVVDDGSKDDTSEIVGRHATANPRIRLVRQENGGIAAARNRGYQETSPNSLFLIFLDHDDLWKTEALSTLKEALEASPRAPAAYGISRFIDHEEKPHLPGWLEDWHHERRYVKEGRLISLSPEEPTTFDVEIYQNRISTVGQVLIRRSALIGLDPIFDPKMVPCDDWDLYLRLCQKGDLVFVPKLVLDRRIHDSNVSSNDAVMKHSEDHIRTHYASSSDLSDRNKKLAQASYRMWAKAVLQDRLGWAKDTFKEKKFVESAKQLRHAARIYVRSKKPL